MNGEGATLSSSTRIVLTPAQAVTALIILTAAIAGYLDLRTSQHIQGEILKDHTDKLEAQSAKLEEMDKRMIRIERAAVR
jgi:hypothetical protein